MTTSELIAAIEVAPFTWGLITGNFLNIEQAKLEEEEVAPFTWGLITGNSVQGLEAHQVSVLRGRPIHLGLNYWK